MSGLVLPDRIDTRFQTERVTWCSSCALPAKEGFTKTLKVTSDDIFFFVTGQYEDSRPGRGQSRARRSCAENNCVMGSAVKMAGGGIALMMALPENKMGAEGAHFG
ncbi:hypothetical protein [Noviherbaspirillum denitrificans]|uniref:hypothetical protein n=1 Tax=Noviherbaspirillum denitrificans TaxID=1968433 RepID=UPI00113199F6|nr:hypothetical protein [Noviherbaspirillum denitrificans]